MRRRSHGWARRPRTRCRADRAPRLKVKTLADRNEKELIVGATGTGIGSYSYPKALSALLGMKFKVILGLRDSGRRVFCHGARRGRRDLHPSNRRARQPA